MSNVLVIDKTDFQGASSDMLCDLARRETLVVSYALCVECLGAAARGRGDLLDRIQKVVKAGACCGTQPLKLVEKEKATGSPIDSIIDTEFTDTIRSDTLSCTSELIAREAQKYRQCLRLIVGHLLLLGETHYRSIVKKGYLSGMRAKDMEDKTARLRQWVQVTDIMSDKVIKGLAPNMAAYLTPEYYTWQDHRLRWVLGLEWGYQKAKSGSLPTFDRASHDFHDMQYVTYLIQADGLFTQDKKLVAPLARVAFPDKAVSSCVPVEAADC